jgi:twitching motility protein PilT
MRRNELDYFLETMLSASDNVSDLNFTVDKPLQVEVLGELVPVVTDPPIHKLTPFQTEMIALSIIGGNKRLLNDLINTGSCDCSYELKD